MRPLLQVISTSPQDSQNIFAHGVDRIELVAALQIGGITPSSALLRKSLEITGIPTMVMVRHHNLGFVLNEAEKNCLIEEAISLCDHGAKGLVIGAITKDNKVDVEFLLRLQKQISNKIDLTFHKASDRTCLVQTYQTLSKLGIKRILTQGGVGSIFENREVIKKLLTIKEVTTLLGGGITHENIQQIVKQFQPEQVHIGTCVRKDKFGAVQGDLVEHFIQKMKY